jgi:hypothetical protein
MLLVYTLILGLITSCICGYIGYKADKKGHDEQVQKLKNNFYGEDRWNK